MPKYAYVAKPEPFRTVRGVIETETEQDAYSRLNQMGYFPISIEVAGAAKRRRAIFGFGQVSGREVSLFTIKLANLVSSGVNLLKALSLIERQTPNAHLRSVLEDVGRRIRDGRSLSEALSEHPKVFLPLYVALVRSAELGGTMPQTLSRLSGFLEKEEEFKGSIAGALMYPAFIFAVSALTIFVLVGYVVPKLAMMFEDLGQALPLPTKMLLGMSKFLQGYWWLIALALTGAVLAVKRSCKTEGARLAIDRMKLKVPFFGPVAARSEIGRLARTLSLLISGGIPIVQALEISAKVVGNSAIRGAIEESVGHISKGSSLSSCLKRSEYFSGFTSDIIAIGEETGTLDSSLARIADDCEKEAEAALKNFSRMLEPVMILVMGAVVGFIVMSMLLPVFQINLSGR